MHQLPDIIKAISLNNKLDESRDLANMVQESLVSTLRKTQQGSPQPRREEGAVRRADRRGDAERARGDLVHHQPAGIAAAEDRGLQGQDCAVALRRGAALPPVAQGRRGDDRRTLTLTSNLEIVVLVAARFDDRDGAP